MYRFLSIATAFLRRDLRIAMSYRAQFMFSVIAGFFAVASAYFVARLVEPETLSRLLAGYRADYFSFVLIGFAATGLFNTGLTGFTGSLRGAMVEGSLEIMLSCPVRPIWVLIMPCLASFMIEGLHALIVIAAGVMVFGADLHQANVPACVLALILTLLAYSVFGLLSAACIVVLKKGDPINWAIGQLTALLAGAFFPVALFPGWLREVSMLLPMTHAYHALRVTLLGGGGVDAIWRELAILAGVAVVGLPLAAWACQRAIDHARKAGTLGSF